MLFAQESTAETHRFNRPRKKPHRAKAKPTHRQGPLFADMLHPTTPYQREYAHHVCGSTTIYNTKGEHVYIVTDEIALFVSSGVIKKSHVESLCMRKLLVISSIGKELIIRITLKLLDLLRQKEVITFVSQ